MQKKKDKTLTKFWPWGGNWGKEEYFIVEKISSKNPKYCRKRKQHKTTKIHKKYVFACFVMP